MAMAGHGYIADQRLLLYSGSQVDTIRRADEQHIRRYISVNLPLMVLILLYHDM